MESTLNAEFLFKEKIKKIDKNNISNARKLGQPLTPQTNFPSSPLNSDCSKVENCCCGGEHPAIIPPLQIVTTEIVQEIEETFFRLLLPSHVKREFKMLELGNTKSNITARFVSHKLISLINVFFLKHVNFFCKQIDGFWHILVMIAFIPVLF